MAKVKKAFICSNCGATSPKWVGQCHHCREWNTYHEEVLSKSTNQEEKSKAWQDSGAGKGPGPAPVALQEIVSGGTHRLITPDDEFNRVLGGGLVGGSVILLGGSPGIGKSTLLLQLSLLMAERVLYVSGEESDEQIKMRADRLRGDYANCFILTETNVSKILQHAKKLQPQLLIVDSIQTMASPYLDSMPGTVSQVRECAAEMQRFAKANNVSVLLVGHVTKEGGLAGPKLLEHIVDVVLQFEGDQNYTYRIMRTIKNRFGSTAEMGIYEMQADGLREVPNPSELLLSQKDEALSGSAVAATMEGLRPMLIETQALVSTAVYGNPQRTTTGFDLRRLNMLLAVLEKRGGLPFAQNDVFLNLAGGLRVDDPAIDLAIISALISSLEDIEVPGTAAFAGEVGLSGEIRAVNRIEQRIQEADRLGFSEMYISKYNLKGLDLGKFQLKINPVGKVEELYRLLFE